jgi:N-acetylglucosaminyl-diphospho-decaprenol L-rhamnosyltransferase
VAVDISIVVVTHRGVGELVRSCLASITAAAEHDDSPRIATIVVDNSACPVAVAADYGSGVDDVIRVKNRGFGAAANAGIRLARQLSDAPVVVLNDDIEVTNGWLAPLLAALGRDKRVGAVQPALLRHGTELINSLGVNLDRFAAGSDRGLDLAVSTLDTAIDAAQTIEVFTGGAVLFRPEFLEATGGFDERYFLYYEDVDLALRGAELGWTYRCATSSVVYHHGGATTADLGDDLVRYQERNRLLAATRFASPRTVVRAFGLSIRRLRHAPRSAHAHALVGGLAAAPGAVARRLAARGRRHGAIVSPDGG